MATEIRGDLKGYLRRFELPSLKCFMMPLKSVSIIFIIELILSIAFIIIGVSKGTNLIMLLQCMLMVGYYIGVLKNDFWNIVLEESKGFLADLIMWIYYIIVCIISLSPSLCFFHFSDTVIV